MEGIISKILKENFTTEEKTNLLIGLVKSASFKDERTDMKLYSEEEVSTLTKIAIKGFKEESDFISSLNEEYGYFDFWKDIMAFNISIFTTEEERNDFSNKISNSDFSVISNFIFKNSTFLNKSKKYLVVKYVREYSKIYNSNNKITSFELVENYDESDYIKIKVLNYYAMYIEKASLLKRAVHESTDVEKLQIIADKMVDSAKIIKERIAALKQS